MVESQDLLDEAEKETLAFEIDGKLDHLLEVNRKLHSLKGSSQAVGFTEYSVLLHDLESLILDLAKKNMDRKKFIQIVLGCIDGFKELNKALEEEEKTQQVAVQRKVRVIITKSIAMYAR